MMKKVGVLLAAFLWATAAFGQANKDSQWPTPGNGVVGSAVQLCPNTSGNAVPCNSVPSTGSQFPNGATSVTGVFSGADTTTAAASLAATPNVFNFVCDVSVTGLGATAINNALVTLAGLAGGNTLTYQYSMPAGATVPATPIILTFSPCKPASAANTAITVTVPGAAGNTSTTINVGGYQKATSP